MKETLRQSMAWLHPWVGLVVGWVLFFVFVMGSAGYFRQEITRWMEPERPMQAAPAVTDSAALAALGLKRLEEVAPVAASWRISLPHERTGGRGWQDFSVRWEEMPQPGHDEGTSVTERLDPVTGSVRPSDPEPRETAGGNGLYAMHYALHYIPYDWAVRLVGICTMLMLLAIVSGIITHKKIIRDFFTFRPGKGQRSWLDAHNVVSVMALPFFLMITYSGLVFFLFEYMPAGRATLYGADEQSVDAYYEELYEEDHRHAAIGRPAVPLAPLLKQADMAWGKGKLASIVIEKRVGEEPEIVLTRMPLGVTVYTPPKMRFNADTGARLTPEPEPGGGAVATQNVLFNLHEGQYADIWGRWLYFVSGLLGCGMIGTGLVLWTVKRRRHHLSEGREAEEHFGMRLVEALNVATIAGLPLAMAAFFWANRLLPLAMANRADWEFNCLFAVWLAGLFYALGRPLRRAWIELLWAASAAFALIPLLNALTTDRHLGKSLPQGDWVIAGFDLTMLALGSAFAFVAVKVTRRLKPRLPSSSTSPSPVAAPALQESQA